MAVRPNREARGVLKRLALSLEQPQRTGEVPSLLPRVSFLPKSRQHYCGVQREDCPVHPLRLGRSTNVMTPRRGGGVAIACERWWGTWEWRCLPRSTLDWKRAEKVHRGQPLALRRKQSPGRRRSRCCAGSAGDDGAPPTTAASSRRSCWNQKKKTVRVRYETTITPRCHPFSSLRKGRSPPPPPLQPPARPRGDSRTMRPK